MQDLVIGNAETVSAPYHGWLIGHFVPGGGRASDAVEVKWGTHAAGEHRAAWGVSQRATSISVLVRGAIRLFFAGGREARLSRPGDYALWPPGLAHRWTVEEDDTIILTVRWPSVADDAVNLHG